MMRVEVVRGVLTVCIPTQHEKVYKDDGSLCIQIGTTQEEALACLEGLSAAVEQLPADRTQVILAAEALKAEEKQDALEAEARAAEAEEMERLQAEADARDLAAAKEPARK